MNVLSLFDGMSCGQLALERANINVDNYFACEIDKYAIQITQKNFPNTFQWGDVTKIKIPTKGSIDLLMGGSPCQGFSFAGKQLNFEHPQSKLFFEFVKVMINVKPKYVLLENVRMKKEYQDVISDHMGFEPQALDSKWVSGQKRYRLYWLGKLQDDGTYKQVYIRPLEDKGIVIKDILEDLPFHEIPNYLNNTWCGRRRGDMVKTIHDDKAHCLTASMWKGQIPTFVKKPIKVGMMVEKVKIRKHEVDIHNLQNLLRTAKTYSGKTNRQIAKEVSMPITKVEHWFRTDGSFAIPSDDVWYKLKKVLAIDVDTFDKQIMDFEYRDGVYESTQRVYSEHGKSPTITASNMGQFIETTSDKPIQVGTANNIKGYDIIKRVYHPNGKSPTLTTMQGGHREPKVAIGRIVNRRLDEHGTRKDNQLELPFTKQLEVSDGVKSNCLTTVQKDNVVVSEDFLYRKLTPLECERLQTLPDNYTEGVSKTQRYKMIGNGWTVDVITHILKEIL